MPTAPTLPLNIASTSLATDPPPGGHANAGTLPVRNHLGYCRNFSCNATTVEAHHVGASDSRRPACAWLVRLPFDSAPQAYPLPAGSRR